jgi:16S rRNA (cytosine967-C5)-methyltransferase
VKRETGIAKRASPARAAAFDILMHMESGAFSGELLHSDALMDLSTADHGLCTEIVMGVLRWRSLLDTAIGEFSSTPLKRLDLGVLTALRMGAYQVWKLSRVPARAAIHQSVELVKRARKRSAAPLVNAVLRKLSEAVTDQRVSQHLMHGGGHARVIASLDSPEAVAHPAWLVERWAKQYGVTEAAKICYYDQQVPPTAIRLRDPGVQKELTAEGIQLAPARLLMRARWVISGDITSTSTYREGRVGIQDEASQLVALLVGSGQRLLDCCAAPGGKTAILAELNPSASVVAAELYPRRAELTRRLVRATNVDVITADASNLPLGDDFDRVLADVPCSGTGTLTRNPEIKWRLRPEDLADLHRRQVAILRGALQYLAPGGRLVYSTCSLEREENEDVVEEVLAGRDDLRVLDAREDLIRLQQSGELAPGELAPLLRGPYLRTIPGVVFCDGFFAAVVERVSAPHQR